MGLHASRALSSALLSALALAGASFGQTFTGTNYPLGTSAGTGPRGLAIGDLNHDGSPDVITNNSASTVSGSVTIFLGSPSGSLGAAAIVPFGTGTPGTTNGNCVLADVNQDTNLDLIVANGSSTLLYGFSVFLGNGAGGLTAPLAPTKTSTSSVTHAMGADFTGDGIVDVILVSFSSDKFFYYTGGAGGVFTQQPDILFATPDGTVSNNVAVEDVDNDGDLDWASGRYYSAGGGGFAVFTNASGAFTKTTYTIGAAVSSAIESVNFGDFDEDGDQDVVLVNDVANQLQFFTNSGGGGGYTYAAGFTPIAIGTTSTNTAVGDVDHDGHLDIAVCQQGPDNLNLFRGDGTGAFTAFGTLAIAPHLNPYQVAIADLNADGQPELVAGNGGTAVASAGVTVQLNTTTPFANIASYGTSTAGCSGTLALNANATPTIGDANFRITCSNAPRSGLGLFILTDVSAASDYLGVFVILNVDVLTSTTVLAFDMFSDTSGTAAVALPVPNDPNLAGLTFFNQAVWAEPFASTCVQGTTFGLVGSTGLSITF